MIWRKTDVLFLKIILTIVEQSSRSRAFARAWISCSELKCLLILFFTICEAFPLKYWGISICSTLFIRPINTNEWVLHHKMQYVFLSIYISKEIPRPWALGNTESRFETILKMPLFMKKRRCYKYIPCYNSPGNLVLKCFDCRY